MGTNENPMTPRPAGDPPSQYLAPDAVFMSPAAAQEMERLRADLLIAWAGVNAYREALRQYGDHTTDCIDQATRDLSKPSVCICGLTALINEPSPGEGILAARDTWQALAETRHRDIQALIGKLAERNGIIEAMRGRVMQFAGQLKAWGYYDAAQQLMQEILDGPVQAPDYDALRIERDALAAELKKLQAERRREGFNAKL